MSGEDPAQARGEARSSADTRRPSIRVQMLGPFEVWVDGRRLRLSRLERALLATLVLERGQVCSANRIIDSLWPYAPPASARGRVQSLVSAIRRQLGVAAYLLRTEPPGYLLDVVGEEVDAVAFEQDLTAARMDLAAGLSRSAAGRLAEALGLWLGSGPALEGVESAAAQACAVRLAELRLTALEDRLAVDLELDGRADVAGELRALISLHPTRERPRSLLMRALHRQGRTSDALTAYREAFQFFRDELGVEPGDQLRQTHRELLAASADAATEDVDGQPRPNQLPPDLSGFAGRREDVRTLTDVLGGARRGASGLAVVAISGMPGVGKTALATHLAHHVAAMFPDGQMYANLRGYGTQPTRTAAEVLHGFLVALGDDPAQLPADADQLAARYRGKLSGRRVLVVLDNAHDEAQVRPLLPGASGCAVVVTSRSSLVGLVAADAAVAWPLDVLDARAAAELFRRRLAPVRPVGHEDRAAAEVDDIVAYCGRLPLALAIAAARAVTLPLSTVAAGLRDTDARLSALDLGDHTPSVRSAFTWSFARLSDAAATLFRSLGAHPGGDFDDHAAASAAGLPLAEAHVLLDELADAGLVAVNGVGGYGVHDLLHSFARELAGADADAARARLDEHLLHTAHHAARLIQPQRSMPALAAPIPGTVERPLADRAAAIEWLSRQQAHLLDAVSRAEQAQRSRYVWNMAWYLTEYFSLYSQPGPWFDLQQLALAAATRIGEPKMVIAANRNLARAAMRMSRFAEAGSLLDHALHIAALARDDRARAITLMARTELADRIHDHPAALRYALDALAAYDAGGDSTGRIYAVHNLAEEYARTGQTELALCYSREAIAEFTRRGDEVGLAHAFNTRAMIYAIAGDHAGSIDWYTRASAALHQIGRHELEAGALDALGDAHHAVGAEPAASAAWRRSLALLDLLDDARATEVRAKLTGTGSGSAASLAST